MNLCIGSRAEDFHKNRILGTNTLQFNPTKKLIIGTYKEKKYIYMHWNASDREDI